MKEHVIKILKHHFLKGKMDGKKIAIVVGAAAVAAAAGYFVYREWGGKKTLKTVRLGGEPPCAASCSDDPACTAYAFNAKTGACSKYTTDPYANFVEDPDWTLFVRRGQSDAPSSWGAWTPGTCPTDCGDEVTRHRECSGKCPGPVNKPCNRPRCPTTERYGDGYVLLDAMNPKNKETYDATSAEQCEEFSRDPDQGGAVGWSFDGGKTSSQCYVWYKRAGPTPGYLTYRPPVPGKPTAAMIAVPGENQGVWDPIPDGSQVCKCGGAVEFPRHCSTGDNCIGGATVVRCSNICAYDQFEGGHL